MSTIATLAEQRSAKLFLGLLHAPTNNNLLILAVIAWMRTVGRGWDPRLMAQKLLTSSVYTPYLSDPFAGHNPDFNLAEVNAALAAQAKTFKLILAAARNGLAVDFLVALAMSSLSPTHYGVTTNYADPRQNRLLAVYSSFTGLQLPAATMPARPKPALRRQPKVPRVLQPPDLTTHYLDPLAAKRFYDARHSQSLQTLDGDR